MGEKYTHTRDKKPRKDWARQTWAVGGKHAQARDKKARKSKQEKHG
jgi:hypothetical protein